MDTHSTHARAHIHARTSTARLLRAPLRPALRPAARGAGSPVPETEALPLSWRRPDPVGVPERTALTRGGPRGSRGRAGRGRRRARAGAAAGMARRPGHGAAARRQGGRGASGEELSCAASSARSLPPPALCCAGRQPRGTPSGGAGLATARPPRLLPAPGPRPAPLPLARPCRQAALNLLEHPFFLQRSAEVALGDPSGAPPLPRSPGAP